MSEQVALAGMLEGHDNRVHVILTDGSYYSWDPVYQEWKERSRFPRKVAPLPEQLGSFCEYSGAVIPGMLEQTISDDNSSLVEELKEIERNFHNAWFDGSAANTKAHYESGAALLQRLIARLEDRTSVPVVTTGRGPNPTIEESPY